MLPIQKLISNYNYSNRNGNTIKYIVLHYTGNTKDTAYNNVKYFSQCDRNASAHYFVDDNEIWQSVEDSNASWAIGGGTSYGPTNRNSISIEMCCSGNYIVSETTEANALELTKYLMNKYNVSLDNVVRHYDCNSIRKVCPNWNANNWARWTNFKNKLTTSSSVWKLGWNENSTGWWYSPDPVNKTYYTSKDGWKKINNEWYLFDSQGYAYKSKWIQDGGKWYYFNDACKMVSNNWIKDKERWYFLGADGAMITNDWVKWKEKWYFVNEDGVMISGVTKTINGKSYSFGPDGVMIE